MWVSVREWVYSLTMLILIQDYIHEACKHEVIANSFQNHHNNHVWLWEDNVEGQDWWYHFSAQTKHDEA